MGSKLRECDGKTKEEKKDRDAVRNCFS